LIKEKYSNMLKISKLKIGVTLVAIITMGSFLLSCTSRTEKVRKKMDEAMFMNYEGDYQGAIAVLSEVIRIQPDNEQAWFMRGNAWFNLRDTEKAMHDLDKAIEINPAFADAWFNRGNIWFFLNDQQRACDDWKEAERLGKPNVGDKTRGCF